MLAASLCLALLLADDPPALADIGPAPAVELFDARNQPFRLADLRGKVAVVSFVYTTCTGSCPATTAEMARVRRALRDAGLGGDRVAFVSISLDPARDTPEVLAAYAHNARAEGDDWHFLTGPEPKVAATLKAWDMWARRDANGVLDHPSRVFLVDPAGRRREIYSLATLSPAAVLADARALIAEAEARRLHTGSGR